jgi:hypothetical protein
LTVNLEILESAYISDPIKIENLNEKSLVPKMMLRRRLSRAAKIMIHLSNQCHFTTGKVVYGSAFGELEATASIIHSIANKDEVSPTAFQNSVYNTAASYHSILHNNKEEVLTVSSFEQTSLDVLRNGALLAIEGDEIFLVAIETLNIPGIEVLNKCQSALECGIAMKVCITDKVASTSTLAYSTPSIPSSLLDMYSVHKEFELGNNIIEVEL